MKLLKSMFSLLTMSIMFCNVAINGYAEFVNSSDVDVSYKISERLLEEFGIENNDTQADYSLRNEKIPVLVWFTEDIDYDVVNAKAVASITNDKNITVNDILTGKAKLSDDDVQEFVESERKIAKKMYQELNNQFVKKHLENADIVYISNYSPVIVAELNYNDVIELAELSATEKFAYYSDTDENLMDVSTEVIRSQTVTSNYGHTGAGIKIGQYEAGVPDVSNVQLAPISSRIHINPQCANDVDGHSTIVADIMVGQSVSVFSTHGVAYGADLYCASDAMSRFAAIEWLIDQNVNVINISSTFGTDSYNTYGAFAQWLDHIALNHYVNVVKSAGNSSGTGVSSGGMAYNIVTVGNIDDNGTPVLNDDQLNSSSSYSTNTLYACKPDICAPGTSISTSEYVPGTTGTSMSAPMVTGTIALMCNEAYMLRVNVSATKSMLLASVSNSSPYRFCPSSWSSFPTTNCYTQFGAGLLDSYRAVQLADDFDCYLSYFDPNMSFRTYNIPVTSTSSAIRVSVAYNKDNSITTNSHTSGSINTAVVLPNLKLEIISPSNQVVATCYRLNSNVQIVEFTPTQTGIYTAKVSSTVPVTDGVEYITVSWKELN